MKHLVMLSGGADSIAVLLDVLKLGGQVDVLHVVLGHSCRKDHERLAVLNVVDYIKANINPRVRYFEAFATFSTYAHRDILLLTAIAHNQCVGETFTGQPYTDLWFGDSDHQANTDLNIVENQMKTIFEAMNGPELEPPLKKHPVNMHCLTSTGLTKQQAREKIGEVFWGFSWSCRLPRFGEPCGKCHSCKERSVTYAK